MFLLLGKENKCIGSWKRGDAKGDASHEIWKKSKKLWKLCTDYDGYENLCNCHQQDSLFKEKLLLNNDEVISILYYFVIIN